MVWVCWRENFSRPFTTYETRHKNYPVYLRQENIQSARTSLIQSHLQFLFMNKHKHNKGKLTKYYAFINT